MRGILREWYQPTTDELKQLWSESLVVLDANVLIGMYQYGPSTLDDFLATLRRLADRLWLPHQVAFEYLRNRERAFPERRGKLQQLIQQLDQLEQQIDGMTVPEAHPTLDLGVFDERATDIRISIGDLKEFVRTALDTTPESSPMEDSLLDALTELYDNKVGDAFDAATLQQLHKEADSRYERSLPPGFQDRGKEGDKKYGDFLFWKQILSKAKEKSSSVILVTNERKQDWWRYCDGERVGPRPELIREFLDEVGKLFHLYRSDEFLAQSRTFLGQTIAPQSILDAERVSTFSPLTASLQSQRMILPHRDERRSALSNLFDWLHEGSNKSVDDLSRMIRELGPRFRNSYVSTPLFFSLINESYGVVRVPHSNERLRDRAIAEVRYPDSRNSFVRNAEAAWIAQGLFRIPFREIPEEQLLTELFGEAYEPEDSAVLHAALEMVTIDRASRAHRTDASDS